MKVEVKNIEWLEINEAVGFFDDVDLKYSSKKLKDRPFIINSELNYVTKAGDLITVKRGYDTDFASVPRFFQRIIQPVGKHGKADIVHDWLCDVKPKLYGYKEAADIFGECMELLGVPYMKRYLMVKAVKLAGPKFKKGET